MSTSREELEAQGVILCGPKAPSQEDLDQVEEFAQRLRRLQNHVDELAEPRPREARCPLKDCGKELYLVVHQCVLIDDTTTPLKDAVTPLTESWDIECENGHRLDSGGYEMDSRGRILGYRSGQSIGGVR